MSNTKDTGFLRNLISYDASGNITLPANLTVTGSLLANGGGSYATQSYVTTQIANLVNAAPGALDTLNELAAALGNDANFSTTVTNSIATKLALTGGTLTVGNNSGLKIKQGNQIADIPASTNFYNGLVFENVSTTNAFSIGYSQGAKFSLNYYDAGSTYSRLLTVSNSGQVGLGIISPERILDIDATGSNAAIRIRKASSNMIFLGTGSSSSSAGTENAILQMHHNGDERIRLYTEGNSWINGGNVGINTNNPLERFSVNGNIHVAGVGNLLYFDSDASGRSIYQYVANLYEFHIVNGRGNSARFVLGNGSISLGTTTTPQFFINTGTGNIGVGTTSPAYNLSVASYLGVGAQGGGDIVLIGGGSGVGAFIQLRYATGTTNVHLAGNGNSYLNANYGNVGIGTTTPSTRLSLGMGIGAKFMVYDNPSTGVYAGLGQDLAGGNSTDFFAHSYGNYGFLTFGKLGTNASTYTEWMRIDPSGNVGIGNTSPLQSLGRTLTVEGTGVFQTGVGGGNYNENLRLNRTGNGYSAIAMGGAYGSTSGSGVGVWTIAATPSGSNYRLDLDYNGGTRLSFRTDGQIQQGGVGIVQVVPIGPTATNVAYSATINGQYTLGSTSIPSDARWLLVDIFVTADISDHQNFMFTRSSIGSQKTWVNTRGNNPASEFGNLTSQDIAIITYFGESDGFSSNYGIWYSSKLIPSVGRTCYINNYGNSNSNGYIYFIVRGYSL